MSFGGEPEGFLNDMQRRSFAAGNLVCCSAATGAHPKGFPQGEGSFQIMRRSTQAPQRLPMKPFRGWESLSTISHAFEDCHLLTTFRKSRSRSYESWGSRGCQIAVATAQISLMIQQTISCTSAGRVAQSNDRFYPCESCLSINRQIHDVHLAAEP